MKMARTGENIYKRKDGRWEARYICAYDSDGKAKYRSVYGISRQEAKRKQSLLVHESMLFQKPNISPAIIFSDLSTNWLNNVKLRVKESTFARYKNQVQKHILPHFGKYQVAKISTELVETLVSHLLEYGKKGAQPLAPKTVEDILIITKNIFKFGKCNHLELDRIKIKKEDKKPRIMSKSTQNKLHQYLVDNIGYVEIGVLLSLHTGIRIGELCALQLNDIELDEQVIHIERTLQRVQIVDDAAYRKTKVIITTPKSKSSIRDIPIPDFLTAIIRKLKIDGNCYLLTGNSQYMEPRTLQNHFKRLLKLSGVEDFNFHSLRHTFATAYVEAGFDVKSLSEILGHSSVKITLELYVHSSYKLKRTNIEKLVGIVFYSPSEFPSLQYQNA